MACCKDDEEAAPCAREYLRGGATGTAASQCDPSQRDDAGLSGGYHGGMTETTLLMQRVYAAFNQRDTDGALALMTEDVRWPKASEGGTVTGKEEIRAYWTRQWSVFDPHVEPLTVTADGDTVRVRVHQVVRSLAGEVLADSEVLHVFTMEGDRIAAMALGDEAGAPAGPTAAFAQHP